MRVKSGRVTTVAIWMTAAILAAAPAMSATVKEGVDAWQRGDYANAVDIWRPLADAGDPDAAFDIAQAYKLGRGAPTDLGQAKAYYGRAARAGHLQGAANYGLLLFQDGDRTAAMPWIKKASDAGDARAQYVYGTALFNGDLAPKDWPRAYALMTRAASSGLPQATTSLSQMDQFMTPGDRQKGLALATQMQGQPTPPTARTLVTVPGGPGSPSLAGAPARGGQIAQVDVPPSSSGFDSTSAPGYGAPASYPPAPSSAYPATTSYPAYGAPAAPKPRKGRKPAPAPVPIPVPVEPAPAPAPQWAEPPEQPERPARPERTEPVHATAGGKWQVQLGAYGSEAAARTAWGTLSAKAAGLRGLKPAYVQAGAIYRLRASGLADRAAADRACASAKGAGAGCFPVAP